MKKLQIIFAVILLLFISRRDAFAMEQSGGSATLTSVVVTNTTDNRAEILRKYLEQFNSPLAPYAQAFVQNADKYNLDWRLVASISGLESTYGQHIPFNSFNGWGWGIYGDNVLRFNSWPEAIETISKGLRENYLKDKTESDPYFIGPSYAASPTWAQRVDFIMQSMDQFRIENAKSTLNPTI